MKLFRHSQGFVVAFGFDMVTRRPEPHRISWSDSVSPGQWEASPTNQAGSMTIGMIEVDPEFVREVDGRIVAYQPGYCIEMTYVGHPYIWSIKILRPDQ